MKYLVLKCLNINITDDIVKFKIYKQSHKYEKFGINDNVFLCKNMVLYSRIQPEYDQENKFFVRGYAVEYDHMILKATLLKWYRIKKSVQKYNDYFGYKGMSIIDEVQELIIPKEMFTL